MAIFLLKFRYFVTLATGVGVIQILFAGKFADRENPMFCVRIGVVSPLQAKL